MAVRSQEMRNNPVRSHTGGARPSVTIPALSLHTIVYIITTLLALLAIYAIIGHVVTWSRSQIDDFRYGNPRTYHTDEVVGHGDGAGIPSHFIAMNLNRQVVVLEIPGGDTSQIRTLTGPYLFGADEDKTPVLLSFDDLNKDGTRDMIVTVKNEAIVYLNRDGQFQPLSPEDRARLEQPQP